MIPIPLMLGLVSLTAAASDPQIAVDAEVTGPYTVEVDVDTDLPDEALLSVSLSLAGLAPEDTFIGTNFVRVPVSGGTASVVLDAEANAQPMDVNLPAGDYDVEVAFHPRWQENHEVAARLGIEDSIRASTPVSLEASGSDRETAMAKQEGQSWVMRNVYGGTPWDFVSMAERFGNIESVELTGSGNPRIIKLWYVPAIDMTFKVNGPQAEVITWVMGRSSE